MQSTTLNYAINYSTLKIFNAIFNLCGNIHSLTITALTNSTAKQQVWGQQPHHLVREDHPAVHFSHCSLSGCCLHTRNGHTSCLQGTWHTKSPTAPSVSGEMSPPCWQRYPPSRDKNCRCIAPCCSANGSLKAAV